MRLSRSLAFTTLLILAASCGSSEQFSWIAPEGYTGDTTSSDRPSSGIPGGLLTTGAWDDNRNFALFEAYLATHASLAGQPGLTAAERAAAHEDFSGAREPQGALDIALLVDTTGSMGDELAYLKVELGAIATRLAEEFPNVPQRWALVVYRDEGDAYVTRSVDFTADLAAFQAELDAQGYDGGGDTPEAADQGLAEAVALSWSAGSVARLMFWVADAPHHEERAEAITDAMRVARNRDVHIYPVAASGVDELAELSMRSAAQLTGGRYLFLTDDSGVGETHKEPTIPCYFVTRLDHAMLRMAAIELSGRYREPAAAELIRTGGDPADGRCELAGGQQAIIF